MNNYWSENLPNSKLSRRQALVTCIQVVIMTVAILFGGLTHHVLPFVFLATVAGIVNTFIATVLSAQKKHHVATVVMAIVTCGYAALAAMTYLGLTAPR